MQQRCNEHRVSPRWEAQAGEASKSLPRVHIMVRLPFGPPYCSGTQSCISPSRRTAFHDFPSGTVGLSISAAIGAHVLGDHPADAVADSRLPSS